MSTPQRPIRIDELPSIGRAVVTLGVFDGVHLGHRAILAATRAAAAQHAARSVALVFDPPPDELLRPGAVVARVAPLEVNVARIEALGIDRVIPIRFDEPLRMRSAAEFLEALAPAVDLRSLVMSRRSAFGHNRDGTPERLEALGAERGFDVVVVDPVEVDGEAVSSTRVRVTIAAGDPAATLRLGVAPYLMGTVVAGDRRGRELGFPTANLRFDYLPALPAEGIYAGRVTPAVNGVPNGHPSLISIGSRPTFHPHGPVLAEVHLLDWDGDLYGQRLGVEFVARLRDQRRFDGVEPLVAQMRRDAEAGRKALGIG